MPRGNAHDARVINHVIEMLRCGPDSGPPAADRVRMLQDVRSSSQQTSLELDEALVVDHMRLREGLSEANDNLAKAARMLNLYKAMPLMPATFLQYEDTKIGRLALVNAAGGTRAVALSEEASELPLQRGDEIFLGSEQSVVVDAVGSSWLGTGEIAEFDRILPDGRLLLKGRGDEQFIAYPTSTLDLLGLTPGALVRWDRSARVAREIIQDKTPQSKYAPQELPNLPLSAVAGADSIRSRVLNGLQVHINPGLALKYGISGSTFLLLYGPPGCGKTLLAKVACAELARQTNQKAFFLVVQAAGFESMWVGETQRNIKKAFDSLKQAAQYGPAVMFIDEIEAMGRSRGDSVSHLDDKFLATFLTELEGFSQLKNIAIIAATNRRDLLDPALMSRMGTQIHVRRPGLRSTRAILAEHLSDSLPYHPNGASASATRDEMIDAAVSRLFAANAGNELCTLKFNDGRTRLISAPDLVSGRLLNQICQAAKQAAFHREAAGGQGGIQVSDIDDAVGAALDQLATSLSPRNAHSHLDDLAADEVVVSVVPHVKRIPNRQRYLTPAGGR